MQRLQVSKVWLAICFGIILAGCQRPVESEEKVDAGDSVVTLEPGDEGGIADPGTTPDPGTVVCDPFNNTGTVDQEHGLESSLYYLDPSLPRYAQVSDYIAHGTKVDAKLYFNQVNVPTRKFDLGFFTQSGNVLTTPAGDTLYEWFALHMDSTLKLTQGNRAGKYQFAILSDDGAVLRMNTGNGLQTVVNNDGTHPSRFGCSSTPVTLDFNSEIPLQIDYYQGPRYHIALIVLWREWSDDSGFNPNDPACGTSGNDAFFDFNQNPSTPTARWNAILARGWKPIPAENFFLGKSNAPVSNPCTDPTTPTDPTDPTDPTNPTDPGTPTDPNNPTDPSNPTDPNNSNPTVEFTTIFGFDGTSTPNSIFLIWQTMGHPATTLVVYGTDPNNLDQVSTINANLTEVHELTIAGLSANTRYYLKAISTDATGKTVESNIISKVTKP